MDEAQKPYKAYVAHAVLALAVFLAFALKNVSLDSGYQAGSGRSAASGPAALININTATAAELTELPGIGEKLAERIVEYRKQNGAFGSIDDLKKVRGIGSAKLEAVRPLVRVDIKGKGEMERNAGTPVR
ncbi:MAG: ComEA family DNA-binding protein [Deltaproteobacteria bacterium]|nr:ComEA family DNA-binding protein [Deltaproteobacteria bacterium]